MKYVYFKNELLWLSNVYNFDTDQEKKNMFGESVNAVSISR